MRGRGVVSGQGSQSRGLRSRLPIGARAIRLAGRRSTGSALWGLAVLLVLACVLLARAGGVQGAPTAPSVARQQTESSLTRGQLHEHSGTLRLPAKPSVVDPLVATVDDPFFPSRARTAEAAVTLDMFTSAEACKECHSEIYAQWSSSMMAHAWEDPAYRAILRLASVATQGKVDKFCIGCHSPIGLTTGTVDAQKGDIGTQCSGVSCDVCHTISSITGAGNASFVLEPVTLDRPVKYGPREDALSPFHDTAHSDLHTRSEFCATCHNVTHPFNRLPVERTYDEWRDSPYNVAGVQCQDCHMTPGPGVATDPGLGGKARPDVYSHFFAGANATMAAHFGSSEAAGRARQMLRSAATIEFVQPPTRIEGGTRADVQVKVTNVGAGHKLPTGFPEGREVWIDFKVQDADGTTLFESGALRDGRTEPGTHSFKAMLGDAQGNAVDLEVWMADRILSDTRILPKGSVLADFSFSVPVGAKLPLTLVADLFYASFSQHLLDELLGPGVLVSEATLMASARLVVEKGAEPEASVAIPARATAGASPAFGSGAPQR